MIRQTQSDIAKRDGKDEPSLAMTENMSIGGFFTLLITLFVLTVLFIPAQVGYSAIIQKLRLNGSLLIDYVLPRVSFRRVNLYLFLSRNLNTPHICNTKLSF